MASNALEREPLRLSGVEERVLELYDRLQGFRLEIALLRARQTHASSSQYIFASVYCKSVTFSDS